MKDMIPHRKEKGFTLIELVMVIVILGILAAFALPRFADLGEDATKATIEAAIASLKSSNAMARASCLAKNSTACDVDDGTAGGNTVTFEGKDVQMVYGYIAADTTSVNNAADLSDYTVGLDSDDNIVVTDTDSTCGFTYTEAAEAKAAPNYSTVGCGTSMPTIVP